MNADLGWSELKRRIADSGAPRNGRVATAGTFGQWHGFNRTLEEFSSLASTAELVIRHEDGIVVEATSFGPNGDLAWRRSRINEHDELVEGWFPCNVPMDFAVANCPSARPPVLAVRGMSRGGSWHGRWRTWHPDGGLASIQDWKAGSRHGVRVTFDPDGSVAERGRYLRGNAHGRWRRYHPNGRIASLKDHRLGRLRGAYATWYETGQIECHGRTRDDVWVGKLRTWSTDGTATSIHMHPPRPDLAGTMTSTAPLPQVDLRGTGPSGLN